MRAAEEGFLLLCSRLGNPDRKVLTVAQLRDLARLLSHVEMPANLDAELKSDDLCAAGCGRALAERIVRLLNEQELLDWYVSSGARKGFFPVTRISRGYPAVVRKKLGLESPGCLWAMGDLSLLQTPCISLAGCRELAEPNRMFAETVGREAARQGYTLVSGNARGADQTAQNACLDAGGKVISVVADQLCNRCPDERILYLSEDGYDEPFTSWRALSRNRVIHALGTKTFVAMCRQETGGTWAGTVRNLEQQYSPVFCFDDGSVAMERLSQMGAELISLNQLSDISILESSRLSLF